jgi:uncharacterized membrane protein
MKLKDKDISSAIGDILRWGVYLSLSVVLIGGIMYLLRHGAEKDEIGKLFTEKDKNISQLLHEVFAGIAQGKGVYIIELGVLLLIATPIARVFFSLLAFAVEKDKKYVLITFIVLMIILLSMFTGFGG